MIPDSTTDHLEQFAKKLESLSGNVEIISEKKDLYKTISKIFRKTDSKYFIGWDKDELSNVYSRLEKNGY
ncbi:MAG: hypothetical protein GTN99_09035, partial [Candidatus Dadabacteria bacterium]|nr:hypothetical protein [Candidatus Dadabacteria bacterium]